MAMLLPETERALLRRLALEQSTNRIPSLLAGLVRDGEPVWFDSRGEVSGAAPTPDTQYRIGSITKSFVGVLVLRLRDEGVLDLADPLDKHLPGTAIGDRSIAAVLAHSSGLSAEPRGSWWERSEREDTPEFLQRIDHAAVRPTPRHAFHYSNTGFGVLGALVGHLRGEPWYDVLCREVLEPLEMRRTTYRPVAPHAEGFAVHPWADVVLPEPEEDAGAMAAAGQLWSTFRDMTRWIRFLLGDTGDVLHPATLAEMRVPAAVDEGDEWRAGYGLGIQLARPGGRRLAGHTGSMPGFLATVWAQPEENTGVVFMANATSGVRPTLCTDLLDVLDEREPRIPQPWRPDENVDRELLELTGEWYWGPSPHVLRVLPGDLLDLTPMRGAGRASRFRRGGPDTWIGLDGYYSGETLHIVRDESGAPRYLDLNTFVFTRRPYEPAAPIPGGVDEWRGAL